MRFEKLLDPIANRALSWTEALADDIGFLTAVSAEANNIGFELGSENASDAALVL